MKTFHINPSLIMLFVCLSEISSLSGKLQLLTYYELFSAEKQAGNLTFSQLPNGRES